METETDTERSRRTATETEQSGDPGTDGAPGTDSATGTNGSDPTITPGLRSGRPVGVRRAPPALGRTTAS